ncbi:hypothetical protein [Mesorhizobium sp. M7A.F.Ca.CA.004.11.2.1]|uniref:hypothetical protein n=1 Tax=unclassified Mesorhizobium TaxID=325217 RepID=UPI0032AFA890
MSVSQPGQMPDGSDRAPPAVDLYRIDVGTCVAFENDEGQASPLCRCYEADIRAVTKDEAVDQGLADIGDAGIIGAVYKAERRSGLVAGERNAQHQLAEIGTSEHVGDGVGARRHEPDGIELAIPQQSSLWIGAAKPERSRGRFDTLAQLRPDQFRPVEDVGNSAPGDTGSLAHVG